MDDKHKWLLYEQEKRMIQDENLSCEEYDMRIRELLDTLDL